MFKRVSWLTIGTGFGFGLAVWCRRAVRARVERYRPQRVAAVVTSKAQRLGDHVRVAVHEGRSAMRQREAELRRTHRGDVEGEASRRKEGPGPPVD